MPLVRMLDRTGCTAFAVRHLNKNVGADAQSRGMGSVAFAAIARIVWLLARDPAASDRFIMSRSAGNLGRRPRSLSYWLTAGSETSSDVRVVWGEQVDATAEDLVREPEARRGPPPTQRIEAEKFLAEVLTGGPRQKKEVLREAELRGYTRRTIMRARETMYIAEDAGVWRLLSPDEQTEIGPLICEQVDALRQHLPSNVIQLHPDVPRD